MKYIITSLVILCLHVTVLAGGQIYNPPTGEGNYILTPAAQAAPEIHGPAVFGVRPGSPFLYTIPASGERPIRFAADGLPDGLQLNAESGRIQGTLSSTNHGSHAVILRATNARGETKKKFTIKVGNTICLTPPLGWNSWNCWGLHVSQDKVLASARAMVEKGLKDYGWTYINIDDAWQADSRGGPFNAILPHPERFPDMKGLCNEIHRLGLKVGIYSTPWITSYAGCIGSSSDHPDGVWDRETMGGKTNPRKKLYLRHGEYPFDQNDIRQWAAWGIDYVKYDWKPNDGKTMKRLVEVLESCGRDIVFSTSNTAPVEQAAFLEQYVNCFRTTGDLKDRWNERGRNLNLRQVWELHRSWMEAGTRGGPGHFPDADMLLVGDVVEGHAEEPRATRLTADEQYAHITLWTLWSSPLLIGCPIERIDDFTLNLLTNPEVLAVHQDELATPGRSVYTEQGIEIVVKELADGSRAVGLFNLKDEAQIIHLDWNLIDLEGKQSVRDIWRCKDIGTFKDRFSATVRPHGVVFVRIR